MRLRDALLASFLMLAPALAAQPDSIANARPSTRISQATLDSITDRGRAIAAYDAASWHGTDAVLALHGPMTGVRGYVARPDPDGRWEVVFGHLSAAADTFYVVYRARQSADGESAFTAAAVRPAEADVGFFARAARAMRLAEHAFGRVRRPYNTIALPDAGNGEWFVYLVPAPTQAGVWPLGGDARYRVSADGRTLLATRRLHNAILNYGPATRAIRAGWHTAILHDRPEDTDVFLVLERRPRVPEYVASASFFFRIDINGHISAFDRGTTRR